MTTPLRAVKATDRAPRRARAKSVTQAAANGTPRELLVAVRTRIAKDVENEATRPADLAALTRRLFEVTRDIEAIDARAAEDDSSGTAEDEAFDASTV